MLDSNKVILFKPAKTGAFWGSVNGGSSKFSRTAENLIAPKYATLLVPACPG